MKASQGQGSHSSRGAPLQCPKCLSYNAGVLDTSPLKARCADCGTIYAIKTLDPEPADKQPASVGSLHKFLDAIIKGGPEGLRAAQREANRLTRKLGVTFEPEWFICTPWLKKWASGALGTRANGIPLANETEQRGERGSRVRVRVAMAWRVRWLGAYAMSASKAMACRAARVGHSTTDYHLKNDVDFAAQADSAKERAIDLLHTRCMQRCLEGDIEPVYWQGEVVGYIRKFDSRLQIEMLRAHMPAIFKTPGTAPVNVETGDKILVMDEATRAKLIERRKERLLKMKAQHEAKDSG
jgi:hypothetical protein